MTTYSPGFQKTINSVSAPESPLILLQIEHEDLVTPIRIVNDRQDLISNGDTFQAVAFAITLPNDPETGLPRATLSVDNVGRDLMQWIESSAGGRGATATIMNVMRSDPDAIEWSTTIDLSNVHADLQLVSANMTFDDILNKACLPTVYRREITPGLF